MWKCLFILVVVTMTFTCSEVGSIFYFRSYLAHKMSCAVLNPLISDVVQLAVKIMYHKTVLLGQFVAKFN